MSRRVLVIVPAYNEEKNIEAVLRDLARLEGAVDVLVVDDGSRDRTSELARPLAHTVTLVTNLGIGGCVQTGVRYAFEQGYDLCVQVDGDGQHPPSEIRRLLEAYDAERASLIVGSRFLGEASFRSTWLRRLGMVLIRFTMRLFHGVRTTDPTSGFRLFDRQAIELFRHSYPLDFPEPISLITAHQAGLQVREIPITMGDRGGGTSSIQGWKVPGYMVRVLGRLILLSINRWMP